MPAAIWTGTISFGLVTVPVRAVSATKSLEIRFNQLEAATGARIRYRRVSEQTGDEVANDQIVKGYEITPDRYVTITDDELQALAPKASRTIDIEDFVALDDIDPVYFERPYYLAPDPSGVKPYRLLVDAMTELRKVAIGRFVMRSKEHLAAIRPVDGVLCLETMRYADEIVPSAAVVPPVGASDDPNERELEMARQLVTALATEFDATKYHDAYREELLDMIRQKAAGEEIIARPAAEEPGKVLDLMAALEASLARAGAPDEDITTSSEPAPPAATRSRAKKRTRGSTATGEAAGSTRTARRASTKKRAPAKQATRARKSA